MLKKRLIPLLLLDHNKLVKTKKFDDLQVIGNTVTQAERYAQWSVDELIYLNISREGLRHFQRKDDKIQSKFDLLDIIEQVSKLCFMPLTFGGGIRTTEEVGVILQRGADRVSLNTAAVETPEVLEESTKKFGSQCILGVIDVKRTDEGPRVFISNGRHPTGLKPVEWAKRLEDMGAGEILVQSIDKDGTASGYDLEILESISQAVNIPTLICGGARHPSHMVQAFKSGAKGVVAANVFHMIENADVILRSALIEAGIPLRAA